MLGHEPQGCESPHQGLYRIGEVSRLTETKAFVLRYWETEFPMLQPVKTPKGHRLYRSEDVEMVRAIKRLLYDEGFTIAGARRHLTDNGGVPATGDGHGEDGGGSIAHANGAGNGHGQAMWNGHGEIPAAVTAGAAPAARHVLRELRTELAAILTLLRGQ
jgi:DNA-binding transcriptional MerR regulator